MEDGGFCAGLEIRAELKTVPGNRARFEGRYRELIGGEGSYVLLFVYAMFYLFYLRFLMYLFLETCIYFNLRCYCVVFIPLKSCDITRASSTLVGGCHRVF